MAFFAPLTLEEWEAIGVEAYNAQAATPAATSPGSTMGAISNAGATQALQLQQQLLYLASIARLLTIPALDDGSPSPDAISFGTPFGIVPIGAIAASGAFEFVTASPVSNGPLVIPVGGVAQTVGGLQFVVIADTSNANYSASLGGYPINNGLSSTTVTMACLTPGSVGNIPSDTSLSPILAIGGFPIIGIQTISNPSALTNGVSGESDASYKARFTITVSSGRAGTANAIIGAVLATGNNIIYSFGDRVNPDLSSHPAFFTLIVNYANTGTTTPGSLITQAEAAVNGIFGRSAGISFGCQGPSLITVAAAATIVQLPGFDPTAVQNACSAQFTAFVNAIGLAPDTSQTMCSLARVYASLLQTTINGAPCVQDVRGLLLNGSASDVFANFAYQLVAGTTTFSIASN